ncbi:MAG: 4Fe-4S binding protein [Deltaproteobacteria bacterium]|nr:4Fe-4S binding protein [Deltaproteobacteria bacterium]
MNLKEISAFTTGLLDAPQNRVAREAALSDDLVGLKMFDFVEIGAVRADDGYFARCRAPEIVGPQFMLPGDWLAEAKSVLSIFFKFTERVMKSSAALPAWPSNEWLHARIEGQMFINWAMDALAGKLTQGGYPSLAPSSDRRFLSAQKKPGVKAFSNSSFTSNWSERHVAFICGLGTFGLSKGLITKAGMSGRFGSLVSALDLPPTGREYSEVYEYCIMCGKCAKNCPPQAISLEKGKNHSLCAEFLDRTAAKHAPRYGCGKCQVNVPCQNGIPGRKKIPLAADQHT